MKFITEEELRESYRKSPFTEYLPAPDTRLTPGARQFLRDHGIRDEEQQPVKKFCFSELDQSYSAKSYRNVGNSWQLKLHTLQSFFLEAGLKLMQYDIRVAQELYELEQILADLENGKQVSVSFEGCAGMKEEHCTELLPDCFEITGAHAKLPKGTVIITLHVLRCRLRELISELPKKEQKTVCKIMNRLSQMICFALGGNVCQKQ